MEDNHSNPENVNAEYHALVEKQIIEVRKIEVDRIAFDAPVELQKNVLSEVDY